MFYTGLIGNSLAPAVLSPVALLHLSLNQPEKARSCVCVSVCASVRFRSGPAGSGSSDVTVDGA